MADASSPRRSSVGRAVHRREEARHDRAAEAPRSAAPDRAPGGAEATKGTVRRAAGKSAGWLAVDAVIAVVGGAVGTASIHRFTTLHHG